MWLLSLHRRYTPARLIPWSSDFSLGFPILSGRVVFGFWVLDWRALVMVIVMMVSFVSALAADRYKSRDDSQGEF